MLELQLMLVCVVVPKAPVREKVQEREKVLVRERVRVRVKVPVLERASVCIGQAFWLACCPRSMLPKASSCR